MKYYEYKRCKLHLLTSAIAVVKHVSSFSFYEVFVCYHFFKFLWFEGWFLFTTMCWLCHPILFDKGENLISHLSLGILITLENSTHINLMLTKCCVYKSLSNLSCYIGQEVYISTISLIDLNSSSMIISGPNIFESKRTVLCLTNWRSIKPTPRWKVFMYNFSLTTLKLWNIFAELPDL